MCVPAHDDRDFEFAKKFDLPIIQVIAKDGKEIENMTEAYTEASGTMINSGEWDGMESSVLKREAPAMIEKEDLGKRRQTISSETGYFPASVTGESQFPLSTAKTVALCLCRKKNSHCFCRMWIPISPQEPGNLRWRILKTG